MKLFWVALLSNPTEEEAKKGFSPRLVNYDLIMARDEKDAAFKFAMAMEVEGDGSDRYEVTVRPF